MVFLGWSSQVKLSPVGSDGHFGFGLMLASNTSGPNGAFISFLKESEPARSQLDWLALARAVSGQRQQYFDLWEGGVMSGADLADAIARYHDLPRVQSDQIHHRAGLFDGLSRRFLREAWVFPYIDRGTLALAVADPTRDEAIKAVKLALGSRRCCASPLSTSCRSSSSRSRTCRAPRIRQLPHAPRRRARQARRRTLNACRTWRAALRSSTP
jgi:hypothetical protein